MDKEKIFLDLSKCSKAEIKKTYKKIKGSDQNIHTQTECDLINGIVTHCYWFLFFDGNAWNQNETQLSGRTEITYPEFIKLFEGGEGENNGWIKVTDSLPNRNDVVLVLTDYGKMDVCIFKEKDHWLNDMRPQHSNGSVVAWMPLPELPKF